MTSMRKTTVVRTAATIPKPSVMKEGRRDVPLAPRRKMNKEIKKARKVRPAAGIR
jgi:hypothetical protein